MPARKEVHKIAWYLFEGLLLALFALVLTTASTRATQATTGRNRQLITSIPSTMGVATNTPACGLTWRGVSSPLPPGVSELDGVAGVSASDVWAVGSAADNSITQTLTMHWDGFAWSIVPSPNGNGMNSWLSAIAARTAGDVWAVGSSGTADVSQTLIEHWDGTAWSIVPSPNVSPSGTNSLRGVTITDVDDMWAVGYSGSTPTYRTLTEHWDGSTWSIIPSPNEGTGDNLVHAVAATGPSDVWAVGTHFQTNISFYRTTTMHWNGSGWTLFTASPSYGDNYFFGVYAISQNNVWAVGGEEDMIEHWNGAAWGGAGGVVIGDLHGVAASAPNDVWAVGYITATGYSSISHYDGSHWLPFPSNGGAHLQAITVITSLNAWAVGFDDFGHVLIERYNDPCATPTTTPTAAGTVTGTPPTATATPSRTSTRTATATLSTTIAISSTATRWATATLTPIVTASPTYTPWPTITPGPTAISCPIQFSDVPPGSTFYVYVECMACRGIISGYPNHTFHPSSNVTRAQFAKIMSNAAGYSRPIPADQQTFEDVAPGSTFWLYIERLANDGLVRGYACGTRPNEPCVPPGNRRYYRPGNTATRGQLAHIEDTILGFLDPVSGQTFEDLPPGSTFWVDVERLAERGIFQGYACGSSGEPCVPPGNRPYFRPGHNLTRGQASKIVANGFFPTCPSPTIP